MALFLAGQVLEADREFARNLRRQKIFRDVTNPLDLQDDDQLRPLWLRSPKHPVADRSNPRRYRRTHIEE